jgi:hypothetical protein
MLYLNPPYHLIRGVAIFPDHANPLQLYYLPAMPKLSGDFDPVTNQVVPNLLLLKYTGEAGSGGFLTFSVNLGIDEEILEEISREIRGLLNLDDKPILSPAIIEDGRVRLMILGKQSAEPPPPGGAPPPPPPPPEESDLPEFVLKIQHYAKPSLYGDNQAVFSVELDQYGTTLIEESLKGEMMPIGIVYQLDFLALRPAYSYRVTADWDRVQKHFEDSFQGRAFFFSTEATKIIDELIEDQVIKIELDTFVPEGEDNAAVLGRRDEIVNEVQDMVLDSFFEPSLNPVKGGKDDWDKATEVANQIHTMAVTGGWAGVATLGWKKVDLTRIDQKRLNVNVSERTTVRRTIYPQAQLRGLFRLLRDSNGQIDLSRFVKAIDLDDDFFKRRTVNSINRADMERDSIQSISVTARYGNEPKNVLLEAPNARGSVDWTSILQNNQMVRDVFYSYKVTFKNADSAERPAVLQLPETLFMGDDLEINPRGDELYHIINVPITALDFPWDAYPHIQIQLRYNDPENQLDLNDSFILDKDHAATTWPLFIRNREKTSFEYKRTFFAIDHRDVEEDWQTTDEESILIRDMRPNKRTVTVIPAVSWDIVQLIIVDMVYNDEVNDVRKEESFFFDNTDEGRGRKVFEIALADPEQRVVTYTIKLLFNDNSLLELPASMTLGREVFVRADMRGHRIITVQPAATDFAARKIDRVKVDLAYEDAVNGLNFANSFTFHSPLEKAHFEFDYVDAQKTDYTAQATSIFNDGFATSKDLGSLNDETLTVPVG